MLPRFVRLRGLTQILACRACRIKKLGLVVLIAGFVAASSACLNCAGQEPVQEPAKTTAESDDMGEDLMAAMKSLDETLNKQDALSEQSKTRDRLVGFGVFGGTFLAIMGVLFGYLRLDHATRGFHSGRLQMLAAFTVVLILATCYLLWTQVLFK